MSNKTATLISLLLIENIDAKELEAKIAKWRLLDDENKEDEELTEDIKSNLREAAFEVAQQLAQMKIDSLTDKLHKLIPGNEDDPIVALIYEDFIAQLSKTNNTYNEIVSGVLEHPSEFREQLDEYAKDILFGRKE
jgi:hypothetical protein